MLRIMIEPRTSHRPQQHRRRTHTRCQRLLRQRIFHRLQRRRANLFLLQFKPVPEFFRNSLERMNRLLSDLGANTIAGKYREIDNHKGLVYRMIPARKVYERNGRGESPDSDPIRAWTDPTQTDPS